MKIEDFEDIVYKKEDNGICTVTISRPERRNAMSPVTFLELFYVLEDMEQDENAKVLIITGDPKGRAFSSGGYFVPNFIETIDKEIAKDIDFADVAQKRLAMRMFTFNKPVIAAINGLAIGGGFTMLLLGADLIYMADDAWIGFYFNKRAIIPEFGLSFLLPFYLGFQKAKEILYLSDKIPAQQAFEIGLVNKILPNDQLIQYARDQALRLIPPKGPSLSINLMKKTMHSYFINILDRTLDLENEGLAEIFTSKDFAESLRSLGEKRKPKFTGE
jgi:enoyl-CoA hydratase/carnithine racemase